MPAIISSSIETSQEFNSCNRPRPQFFKPKRTVPRCEDINRLRAWYHFFSANKAARKPKKSRKAKVLKMLKQLEEQEQEPVQLPKKHPKKSRKSRRRSKNKPVIDHGDAFLPKDFFHFQLILEGLEPLNPIQPKQRVKKVFLSNEGDSFYISDFFHFHLIIDGVESLIPGVPSEFELELQRNDSPIEPVSEQKLSEPKIAIISPIAISQTPLSESLLPGDFPIFKVWASQPHQTFLPGDFHHFRESLREETTFFFPKDFFFWQNTVSQRSLESYDLGDFFQFHLILEELAPLRIKSATFSSKPKKIFVADDGSLFITDFQNYQSIVPSLEDLDLNELSNYEFILSEEQLMSSPEEYFPSDFLFWRDITRVTEVFLPVDFPHFQQTLGLDTEALSYKTSVLPQERLVSPTGFLPRGFFLWQNAHSKSHSSHYGFLHSLHSGSPGRLLEGRITREPLWKQTWKTPRYPPVLRGPRGPSYLIFALPSLKTASMRWVKSLYR